MAKRKTKGLLSGLQRIDRKVHKAVKPYEKAPPVKLLSAISELGDQPPMLTLSGGVLALGIVTRRGDLTRAGARMIAAHLLATGIKTLVKGNVDRTRPFAASSSHDHKLKPGSSQAKEESSFPSGHSAGALAVALAFGREVPAHRGAALAGAGLIAAAQVPRCAHYPTDVGAGLAIGWLSDALVNVGVEWWRGPASASPLRPV